jgi:hypothetical protein
MTGEVSWTGSEKCRKPQGICLPPTREPTHRQRFVVPADVECTVRPVREITWRKYVTANETGYEKCESYDPRTKKYTFRRYGYLMSVHRRHVVHRDDTYGRPN